MHLEQTIPPTPLVSSRLHLARLSGSQVYRFHNFIRDAMGAKPALSAVFRHFEPAKLNDEVDSRKRFANGPVQRKP